MKYIAVLDTDDFYDFDFFEDGKEKYLHAIDAASENGEWIYLPFKPLEQEPILDELKAEITTLQNRCYALTKGTMCAFCKYECEYKAETEE